MEIDDATAPTSTATNSEDIDADCNNLLQEFSRLGTTDRDVLISKMQQLINGLSAMESTFFLDMNNWNLEAAIWTYYDLSSQVAGNHAAQQQQQQQLLQQQRQQQQQLIQQQTQLPEQRVPEHILNSRRLALLNLHTPQEANDAWAVNLPARFMTLIEDRTVGDGEAVTPDTPFVKTWRLRNTGLQEWPEGCVFKYSEGHRLQGDQVQINRIVSPNEEIDVSVQLRSPADPGCYFSYWRLNDSQGPFGDVITIVVQVQEGGVMAVTQQMDACHACE